ncbi:MAG TPA: TrkA family potassium uptake protein [Gammaproteobacteria bacterium]|nr:TrkA family potassium uptake protein [Gammaproteobacteria bacterium]
MNLVVIGAGQLGESVVALAAAGGHNVVVVESNPDKAAHCAETYDVRVMGADIADDDVAGEASLDKARAVIATTGDDSANLMAMFLAREAGSRMLATVVNHRSHQRLFEKLGARVLVDPELLLAQHLLDIVMHPGTADVTTLAGNKQILDVRLTPEAPVTGRTPAELAPELDEQGLQLVATERDERRTFPEADRPLAAGDLVTLFALGPTDREDLLPFLGNLGP